MAVQFFEFRFNDVGPREFCAALVEEQAPQPVGNIVDAHGNKLVVEPTGEDVEVYFGKIAGVVSDGKVTKPNYTNEKHVITLQPGEETGAEAQFGHGITGFICIQNLGQTAIFPELN